MLTIVAKLSRYNKRRLRINVGKAAPTSVIKFLKKKN